MKNITCECGHVNPEGTHLCEKCGRPLTEEEKHAKVVDMKYEGRAIRSKTYNKTIIDKIWNFFSSVKVGVSIIVITLVAAAIGTFLPQVMYVNVMQGEDAKQAYIDNYGTFGKIYYNLGLSDIYSSWWFQTLIGMLAISIIAASIDRGVPLYKSLKNQRVKRHESFMKRQRIFGEKEIAADKAEESLNLAEKKMKELKYKVRREDGVLLAEKNRFARSGPYINHVGLIIFLFGVMLRLMPGFYIDESLWIREGETASIPGMDGYYLHNNKFTFETYKKEEQKQEFNQSKAAVNSIAKNYQSDVVLYQSKDEGIAGETQDMKKVAHHAIQVNKPLKYDGYALYQMDFKLNELKAMNFNLVNKKTGKSLGEVDIDLTEPKKEYDLGNGSKVEVKGYYPTFSGFDDGEPQSDSPLPNNPAFIFKMYTPETPKGETSFVAIKQTLEPLGTTKYQMKFQNIETRNVSGLTIRKDRTLPILAIGGIIFMLGVVIGSYWSHRRLWLQHTNDGRLLLAAHTNKNWFSMKKDLDAVTTYAHLPLWVDQQEEDEKEMEEKEGDNTL
ncbi:cytochrome c biogenesis protein ResB [Rummeliibacillus sp. G93]|uniref:cytochrome c biogenesis protein ResB n=1 Tax=Rummeliibacillus sp. G93 TaxID=2939494 RepID=UPI00201C16E0|nr:cytochrome c biogenesis protein ResB [Rummeliibacillus sp. G93]UQW98499.1 cytochrome c biogenesis protein ResB [Rummeliibacillus sp. G93]